MFNRSKFNRINFNRPSSGKLNLSEKVIVVDSIVFSFIVKGLTEVLSIADSIIKSGIKSLSEDFSLTDVIPSFSMAITESLHFVDSIATSGLRQLGETIHTIDSILHRIFVDEVIAITDAVGVTAIKLMYETLHIVDWFWAKLRKRITNWEREEK